MSTFFPHRNKNRVYCAGPLFNAAERREMEEVAAALETAGYDTFVPHRTELQFARIQPWLIAQGHTAEASGRWLHDAIFASDAYEVLAGCGSLVFNMNGRVPDEGGTAEAAMAWTLGKPIVLFKNDSRSAIASRDNPLIAGLAQFRVLDRIDEIGRALADRFAELSPDPRAELPCPPQLRRPMEAGRKLLDALEALGDERPAERIGEIVLTLFGQTAEAQSR